MGIGQKSIISQAYIELLKIKDATHYLCCRHVIGRNVREYGMKCIILDKISRGRLKILVFGERYWKGHNDKKQIRYVYSERVIPINRGKR